jgi:hypothetical protein
MWHHRHHHNSLLLSFLPASWFPKHELIGAASLRNAIQRQMHILWIALHKWKLVLLNIAAVNDPTFHKSSPGGYLDANGNRYSFIMTWIKLVISEHYRINENVKLDDNEFARSDLSMYVSLGFWRMHSWRFNWIRSKNERSTIVQQHNWMIFGESSQEGWCKGDTKAEEETTGI